MKYLMQAIFELLDGFMEDGGYEPFDNSIVFWNNGKQYALFIEEIVEEENG